VAIVALVCVAAGVALLARNDSDTDSPSTSLSDEVLERLAARGVAPNLVYVVDLPGYELAEQSAGVVGNDGFGATYVSQDGSQVTLSVDHGRISDDLCAAATTCESDATGLYRVEADRHEYLAEPAGDVLLRLAAPTDDVDRSTLGAATTDAHLVEAAAPASASDTPTTVERGDLPSTGDGAPNNTVGPGG
jgi:hypothetical protein